MSRPLGADAAGEADLRGRDLLRLSDLSPAETLAILAEAARWKSLPRASEEPLRGRVVGMLFRKPSTRTRLSFQAAVAQLGGQAVVLDPAELQLSRGETVADTARVLSRYLDGLLVRTFAQEEVEELARHASIPVINGLTDRTHPTQALADLLTLRERFGRWRGLRLAYVGDGNNVCHSLLMAAALVGMDLAVASPPGYEPEPEEVRLAAAVAAGSGGRVEVGHDPVAAVAGAHAVYTDVWASMGREEEREERLRVFAPYRVDAALMAKARPEAVFLHCLPAHRGEEVTTDVLEGPRSLVWEQAENRLHVFKGILSLLFGS